MADKKFTEANLDRGSTLPSNDALIPFTHDPSNAKNDYASTFQDLSNGAGYPGLDNNGNLLASVTPRVGTMDELEAVTDAGDGEVATIIDTTQGSTYVGQMIYSGDPTSRQTYVGAVGYHYAGYFTTGSGVAIPPDTANWQVVGNPIDYTLHNKLKDLPANTAMIYEVTGRINNINSSDTGSLRGVFIEYEIIPDTWAPFGESDPLILPYYPGVSGISMPFYFSRSFGIQSNEVGKAIRFLIKHDASADLTNVSIDGEFRIMHQDDWL